MAMTDDLVKEARRQMEPESYGQWEGETYRLMASAADAAQTGKVELPYSTEDLVSPDSTAGMIEAFNKAMKDSSVMTDPATKVSEQVLPLKKDSYSTTNNVMNGYYFMTNIANTMTSMDPSVSGVVKTDEPDSRGGYIEGLDVLDPNFLGKMANDYFRNSDAYMREMTGITSQGIADETVGLVNKSSVDEDQNYAVSDLPYFMTGMGMTPVTGSTTSAFDVESIRRDFPILQRNVHGKQLIWLDNGATTQKPQVVIDRVSHFYKYENSNVHRGAHALAAKSTDAYEGARCKIAAFMGAGLPEEVIYVRGTTEGINLIANICGEKFLGSGDEIILTEAEHHANIVPWQFIAQTTGAVIRIAPIDDNGEIIIEEYNRLLGPRTKIVSMTHVSNALGTVLPINEMTAMAKKYGAIVIIDGAQGVPHRRINVQEIGCDFYVFSGHKLFGPTGIGAVWGRKELWEEVSPWQGGGSMIERVTFEKSTFANIPNKFEAGTGALASAVGLGAAIDYVSSLGLDAIERYETDLVNYAVDEISRIKGIRMIGMPKDRAGVISFVMEGIPVSEVGKLLDAEGIAIRAGHHCAQPVLAHFGLEATVRPAFAFYNTRGEVDTLVSALNNISSSLLN